MNSCKITLRGPGSELVSNFFPAIPLLENHDYSLALIDLEIYDDGSITDVLRVECNLIQGSYVNGREMHILHESTFDQSGRRPPVRSKVLLAPRNLIYLPINTRYFLDTLVIRLLDHNGVPFDLRNNTTTVRLHLRKDGTSNTKQ